MVRNASQNVHSRTALLSTTNVKIVLFVIPTILTSTEYVTTVQMLLNALFVMVIIPVLPVSPATLLFQMELVLAAAISFALPAPRKIFARLVLRDTASMPPTHLRPASLAILEAA